MQEFLRLPWGGHEVGGVLFGTRHPDCLRIVAYRPLSCGHVKGPAFALSESDKARLRKLLEEAQKDEDLAGMQPVGWYHTKYRSFDLTRDDLEVYNAFFPNPWQVAMVFQRGKGEPCVVGFFSRRKDGSLHSAHRTFTVIEERPGVQAEPRAHETPTRSLLSDPILAGSGASDPPKAPAASPSLAGIPEPEKLPPTKALELTAWTLVSKIMLPGPSVGAQPTPPSSSQARPTSPEPEEASPTEETREPLTQTVLAEPSAGGVRIEAKEARPQGGDGPSLPVSEHRQDSSPLQQRPEYKRVLQYLDPAPGDPPLPPSVESTLAEVSHCEFFGLRKNPFSRGPIPAFPYWSAQHKETLAGLRYGVQTRKGLMVVTGESGTGKTILLKCLGDFLTEQSVELAFLPNSKLTTEEFYEMVNHDLGLGCEPPSRPSVQQALSTLLDARAMQDKTTVLIIDDAQNLGKEILEGIQQWDSLQDRRGRLLQTVLCGFPELERSLEAETLRALKKRVALRCHLRPFTEEETVGYIDGQLTKAGMAQQTIFARDVMVKIHIRSGGLLRVVNMICDKLLEKCFDAHTKAATIAILDKVSIEMQLKTR
jgi:general secretion pathway protein A